MKYSNIYRQCAIVISLILVLSACHKTRNTEYFLLHPDEIQPTYDKCVGLEAEKLDLQAAQCVAVTVVIPLFKKQLEQLVNNPNAYAMAIMNAQIKLVQLHKDYKAAKQETGNLAVIRNLANQIKMTTVEIQSRFAVIRLMTQMNR